MSQESVSGRTRPLVSTGVDGLDVVLRGGLPRERIYLLQGDPGAGKTTLALQFLMKGCHAGERCMYVTLSESADELNAVAKSHGWDLTGIHIYEATAGEEAEELGEENQYDVFHPSEVELGEVMRALVREAERFKPTLVVIDSLSEVRLLAREPIRYRQQLLAFKRFFLKMRATILLLDASIASRNADLQSNTLVHGVIHLEQSMPDYGLRRRRLHVVKLRGVSYDDSYHDFRIKTGGLEVFPRLAPVKAPRRAVERVIPSGNGALDRLLGGGLVRGSSNIVMGAAGTGKSTLSGQYVTAAAARGEVASIFTFDESDHTWIERSEDLGLNVREHLGQNIFVTQVDPGEQSPGEFAAMVRQAVERDGASIVVIDSLNGYLNAAPGERFILTQLHELLAYLCQANVCTLLIVAQQGLIGAMSMPLDVSYLGDSVLLLRYFEHRGQVRKAISVLKKRRGPHELTIREFEVTTSGLRVGEPLEKFHGVLTGTPDYFGDGDLLGGENAADK